MQGLFQNLVAYWKMDDNAASTTVVDETGNCNGTAQQNTEDITATGKINTALSFNGTSDYVSISTATSLRFNTGDFSISFWLKRGRSGVDEYIFDMRDGTNDGWRLWIVGANDNIYFSLNDKYVWGTTPIQDTNWHCILLTINRTTGVGQFYSDNVATGSTQDVSGAMAIARTDLFIGATITPSDYFQGALDAIMIFNKALSTDEVAKLYNNGNGIANLSELDDRIRPRRFGTANFPLRSRYEFRTE